MVNVKTKPITIGTCDYLDLPDCGIFNLPCKIDTGADTSAIHCERFKIKEINGEEFLCFRLLDKTHPLYTGKEIRTKNFKEKKIKSSFGDYEFRYQIQLTTRIFNKKFNTSFTLSNRKNMKFAVLLGKRFLKNRFIVDVAKKNLSFDQKDNVFK